MAGNTFKKAPEVVPEVVVPEPQKPVIEEKPKAKEKAKTKTTKPQDKNRGVAGSSIKSILDGSILTKGIVIRSIPMILLLVFLGIIFIANRYQIERKMLKINKLKKELQVLNIRHIETKQNYMQASKLTEISRLLDSTGVQESQERPQKIIIRNEE